MDSRADGVITVPVRCRLPCAEMLGFGLSPVGAGLYDPPALALGVRINAEAALVERVDYFGPLLLPGLACRLWLPRIVAIRRSRGLPARFDLPGRLLRLCCWRNLPSAACWFGNRNRA